MSQELFCMQPFEGRRSKKSDEKPGEKNDFVQFHRGKLLLCPSYADIEEKILDASVREDDVWLVSFPRTGSTWCQEMIWLIRNKLDFEKAQTTLQQLRAPLIESSVTLFEHVDSVNHSNDNKSTPIPRYTTISLPFDDIPNQFEKIKLDISHLFSDSVGFIDTLPSPRCIKSHLSIELLPEQMLTVKPKVIYTMRNPKDLCVSYFFHCQLIHKLEVDFETFCELFLNDAVPIGSVFNHYLGFWKRRHDQNILILRYEDMKSDTRGTVKKIANFLEQSLTDEDIDAICEFLSFHNMRENKACNLQIFVDSKQGNDFYKKSGKHFIRKGIVGDHKNYMSPEMIQRFDEWIEENTRGTDLKF